MSKIPPRLTFSGIDAPLYVPMDGEGNATVPHKLTTETLEVRSNVVGDLNITGGVSVDNNLNVYGNIIAQPPSGKFIGNGAGITNLPPQSFPVAPAFYFQSSISSFFSPLLINRFDPVVDIPTPVCTIACEMYGRPPGLYFWKTEANIILQQLFNSASGLVYWDGTKVTGETTWSLYQPKNSLNPYYSLTWSYLFTTSLTGFFVTMESTNSSINPGQPNNYYVNFYKLADITSSAPLLPAPTGVEVTAGSTTAAVVWTQNTLYNYAVYVTGPAGPNSILAGYDAGATNTYNLTGLTASSEYSVQVQASLLGPGGTVIQVSELSAPVIFTTTGTVIDGPVEPPVELPVEPPVEPPVDSTDGSALPDL